MYDLKFQFKNISHLTKLNDVFSITKKERQKISRNFDCSKVKRSFVRPKEAQKPQ
jgi:hypothetical protein